MIKRFSTIFILVISLCPHLFAHSGKPKFHVIIDTDGAIDDMRSISMFLSQNETRVLAITCSQGTLLPGETQVKANNLLSNFHHEGIPVGIGCEIDKELPAWHQFAKNIRWAGPHAANNATGTGLTANKLLNKTVNGYRAKITLVALGTLKTYADWLKHDPQQINKIERIIWYNDPTKEEDFNYMVSPESFDYIKSLNIRLDIVGNNSTKFFVGNCYFSAIKNARSQYAEQIIKTHAQTEVVERIKQKHLVLWDDIIPLYLVAPILFESQQEGNLRRVTINNNLPEAFVYDAISKLLGSGTTATNRVFSSFPVDTTLYKIGYAQILGPTIEKFGQVEWKAICMTNEVHGHTGIYSIIGAKMGIRAMEYFNVGVNNLSITSFAGNKPPLSCFNDGLQISTGATIGQGLITISDTVLKTPVIIAAFNKQKIKISLKPKIAAQMQKDIKHGVETYGLESEFYWAYVEKLAIKYWSRFDRNGIFLIESLH